MSNGLSQIPVQSSMAVVGEETAAAVVMTTGAVVNGVDSVSILAFFAGGFWLLCVVGVAPL